LFLAQTLPELKIKYEKTIFCWFDGRNPRVNGLRIRIFNNPGRYSDPGNISLRPGTDYLRLFSFTAGGDNPKRNRHL
jgi:hypothetical protein